jgi:signal transduction histidine kinase/pSer/pThr/pTyr-binding forkhead associated (FHA) protein
MRFIIYDKSREEFQVAWVGKPLVIGRRVDADIQVDEPTMSGTHAQIYGDGDAIRIRDLESLNGTHVNGRRIVETVLAPGDEIRIGRVTIVVAGPARWASGSVTPAEGTVKVPRPVEEGAGGDELPPTSSEASGETPDRGLHLNTQTIQVSLDELSSEQLQEDDHILLLRNLFEALESAASQDEVLRKVRMVLRRAFRRARVFLLRPDAGGGWHDPETENESDRGPSRTFAAEAARTKSAILSQSLPDDRRFSRSESARISGIKTAIAAPASCEGCAAAVLYVDRLGPPAFTRRDLHVLGIAANHVTAVLDNVARIEALRRTNAELVDTRESLAELNRNLEQLVEERTVEIQRQADEISRLAEAKDELVGIAAHDIRGPLTVIQGTTELLRLRLGELETETLRRSLDLIHGACRGLTRLLSELLDAKAIESGKITLRLQLYAVRQLIEESLPVARLAADDKGVELVVEAEPELVVDVDPQRLAQAITNLVLNAVKFSPSGTRILVRGTRRTDEVAEIEVEDQGIGIPEDELEEIFGTFEQGTAGQQFGGSGLGLMIAKRIVELHGGTLTVKSKVGVGTRFTLSVPAAAIGVAPLEAESQAASH